MDVIIRNFNYKFWILYRLSQNFIYDHIISIIVKIIPRRYRYMKYKQFFVLIFIVLISIQLFVYDNFTHKTTTPIPSIAILNKPALDGRNGTNSSSGLKIPSEAEFRMNWIKNKLERIAKHSERWEIMKFLDDVEPLPEPTTRIHIFYQVGFRNIEMDNEWSGWNHDFVFNKIKKDSKLNSRESPSHNPPINIASNFYPLLGCYSSKDPNIINTHFKEIRDIGIGVVVVSWLPLQQEKSNVDVLALLLDVAEKYGLKIALHIEVYVGHNVSDVFKTTQLIIQKYSNHKNFYKLLKNGKHLPVFYIFYSYRFPVEEWKERLASDGELTVRGSSYDAIFIGHLRDANNKLEIHRSNFDGFYTYYASNAYTYGSTWKNWNTLAQFAEKHNLLFFPSVAPGYVDTNARPWNSALTRHRTRGHYYQVAWRAALASLSYGVSVTSYNWHDGSQIEPALPHNSYLDYQPEGPPST
ncbi:glycoprotein endo-alpha-1,2-mannosidase isoform X2 [Macrosteles quadrilineatus]|uniref:glycoprotein endo-alpha-1,2-mannosidase isoform X2 n=1 Tax=Macrosteles quadrilineatus TaxID=74068 RepID=UPI0023E1579E|nr:glycoprotein endo-alpha-1,2-mannosidase isoform X2 [Macrosteles quadrilineatus]